MEAAKFSKLWLPFCKKNKVQDRSPEVYFSSNSYSRCDEAKNLQMMYEDMKSRVEHVVEIGKVETEFITCDQIRGVFDLWTDKFTRHDHPAIIQVLQNSKADMNDTKINTMPNLIYVSREKSKVSRHHFKAGALNTLLRVSGVMTNSPIILTLDCDMYSNDPTTPVRALCYLTDPKIKSGLGYVQFPQKFDGLSKNDIYACEYKRLFDINLIGFDGLMGPTHMGTGCFFNRRVFYGPPSNFILPEINELSPSRIVDKPIEAQNVLTLAHDVARCNYEHNTNWGSKIGFRYGSLVEDYYTGYMLHCEGWRSVFCSPKRAAFRGDAPKCLLDVVSQQKRWAFGLLEVALSSKANDDFEQSKRYEQEIFDFGPSSSVFLPMTTIAIVNLFALILGFYHLFAWGEGLVLELMLASFAVVNCLPVYEAMFLRKDDGKLPKRVCVLAGILTCVLIVSGYFLVK
ncbi:Cellulose synthase-like protein G3 [Cardamine amara subsp. amara]|uniref:Cellulose synthase-like protein G3 n=1 Tax=Cardamine amara subsp. amara TaxID=228776 RepID=A0ABD1BZC2_CARAN